MSASAAPPISPQDDVTTATMKFLTKLASDVAKPGLTLPSYPQVSLRLQRLLSDPNSNSNTVAQAIAAEPMLAARVLALSNSAAIGRSRNPVVDLGGAISTLGFDALRTAAISFALTQLRQAAAYRAIEQEMVALWTNSVNVAATCHVLARQVRGVPADTAMLAGLISDVGKLYILVNAPSYPALFASPEQYNAVVAQWHPQVARAILEHWSIHDDIIDAIANVNDAADDTRSRLQMVDVVAMAQLLVDAHGSTQILSLTLPVHRAAQRLGLDVDKSVDLMAGSSAEITAMRMTLGL